MSDFNNAITSLRKRSIRSRRISLWITASVLFLAAYLFTVVAVRFTEFIPLGMSATTNMGGGSITNPGWNYSEPQPLPPRSLLLHLNQSVERILGPLPSNSGATAQPISAPKAVTQGDIDSLKQQSALLIEAYKSIVDAQKQPHDYGPDWSTIVASLALSVGSIGLLLLVLQVIIAFIRYYARLAELYDAQADALEASDGSADDAYQFIERFSPAAVDFGRLPTPIYEKAIDALAQVAKGREPKP